MMLFIDTVFLSLITTFIAVLFGVFFGVIFEKTTLAFKHTFLILFTLPLLLPPYITALSFSELFGEWLFSFKGVVLVESVIYLPIPMLVTFLLLKNINSSHEDSARIFCPWICVLQKITLPLILPYLFLVSSIVFILSFGNYSVVNFLRYNTFISKIFVEFSAFYEYKSSIILSLLILLMVFMILWFEKNYIKKNYATLFYSSRFKNKNLIELKNFKYIIFTFIFVLLFSFILLPIITLVINSASLSNYIKAFELVSDSIYRSIIYSSIGALIITLFSFLIALIIKRKQLHILDFATISFFALPSSVIAIGLIYLFNNSITSFIYSSPIIIIIAYILKYSALSNRIFSANLAQLPHSFEDSAKVLGASKIYTVLHITAPLLKGSFLLSYFLSFIFLLRDTDMTMLLYSAGNDTFAVKLFTLMANSPQEMVSALCVMMLLIILTPILLWLILRKIF